MMTCVVLFSAIQALTPQQVDASDCPMLIQRILNDKQNQKLASVKQPNGKIRLISVYQFGFDYYLKLVIENPSIPIKITTELHNISIPDYWVIHRDNSTECIMQIQCTSSPSEKFTFFINGTAINIHPKFLSKAIEI